MSTKTKTGTAKQGLDVHNLGYDFQNWIYEFVEDLTPQREGQVVDFLQEMELSGKSKSTVRRYVEAIKKLGIDGKPYHELDREDLIDWMRNLPYMKEGGDGKYSEQTVNLTKRLCKRFLRFCHTGELYADKIEDYPEVLECIQYQQPNNNLPKEILTKEEVKKIVEVDLRIR